MRLEDLAPAAIALVVTGITVAIGVTILTNFMSTLTVNTYASNATNNSIIGISNLSSWFSQIGTIIAAAVIIGLVVSAFYVFKPSGGST